MSDTLTQGIRVQVFPSYVEDQSNPQADFYFFAYRINITNTGEVPAQLLSRHWIITDGGGETRHVRGPGVVGEQPRLEPGEGFSYTSFCPLTTQVGTMEGSFQMVTDDGRQFDASVGAFTLYAHRAALIQDPAMAQLTYERGVLPKELVRILAQSFNATEERWQAFFETMGQENMRVVRRGGEVAAGLGIYPMGQYFGGRSIPMAGIAAVVSAPQWRGEGLANEVLRRTLMELHEQGTPLSALHPAALRPYRKVGYEIAGVWAQWRVPLHRLGGVKGSLPVTKLEIDRIDEMSPVFRQRAERHEGHIDRNEAMLTRLKRPPEGGLVHLFVVGEPKAPEGYVVYHQSQSSERQHLNQFICRDLVANSRAAAETLLAFFFGQRSLATHLSWHGGIRDIHALLLPDAVSHPVYVDPFMLRLVDVEAAFRLRGYRTPFSGELHLQIQDDLIAANNDRFTVTIEGGRAEVARGGRGELVMHVDAAAALYSGHFSAATLKQAGQLSGDEKAIQNTDALLLSAESYVTEMF